MGRIFVSVADTFSRTCGAHSSLEWMPCQKQGANIRPWTSTLSKNMGWRFIRWRILPTRRMDFANIRKIYSHSCAVCNIAAVEDRESNRPDKQDNPKPGTSPFSPHRRPYPETQQQMTGLPRFPGRTRHHVDLNPLATPSHRGQLRRHLWSQLPGKQSPADGRRPVFWKMVKAGLCL